MSDSTAKTPFWPAAFDDAGMDVYEIRALLHVWRVAGDKSRYYQSNSRAARECGISERRYRKAMLQIAARGAIRMVSDRGETGTVKTYVVCPEWTPAPETAAPRTAVPHAEQSGTTCRPTPAPRADKGTPLKVLPEGTPLPSAAPPARVAEVVEHHGQRRTDGNGREWNGEAADLWRKAYGAGIIPQSYFKQLKPIAARYSWERVAPVLALVLAETPVEYLNLPKVLGGSFEALEQRLPMGPRPRCGNGKASVSQSAAMFMSLGGTRG